VIIFGVTQFGVIGDTQPAKLAGPRTMAGIQADMVARYGPGDYGPPGWITGARDSMIYIWLLLFLLLAVALVVLRRRRRLTGWGSRVLLRALVWAIPLPFAAAIFGWLFREVGRQPWIVYGLLKTADAVSPLRGGALAASLTGFGLLVGALAVVDWWLLARYARRGPGDEFQPGDTQPEDLPVFAVVEA
jgi:cytochrome d ubiquinol oxidase subunit I